MSFITILAVSDDMVQVTKKDREEMVSIEVFPDNPAIIESIGHSVLRKSLNGVMESKGLDEMPVVRYDLVNEAGEFEERYWQAKADR